MVNAQDSMESAEDSPFSRLIGLEDGRSDSGIGAVSLEVQPQHLQGAGVVHGGLIATMGDTAFFRAVRSVLAPGERTTTIELKVNFLAPAAAGRLTATARVISQSPRLVAAEMEVRDQQQRLIAQGLGTYLRMR